VEKPVKGNGKGGRGEANPHQASAKKKGGVPKTPSNRRSPRTLVKKGGNSATESRPQDRGGGKRPTKGRGPSSGSDEVLRGENTIRGKRRGRHERKLHREKRGGYYRPLKKEKEKESS